MLPGAIVKTLLFRADDKAEFQLVGDFGKREVSISQSNSFALKTQKPSTGEIVNSWCDWPKKNEFVPIDNNTAAIVQFEGTRDGLKLIYQFI